MKHCTANLFRRVTLRAAICATALLPLFAAAPSWGAGGNIGADIVAKSAPDGYTMVMGTVGTHFINGALFARMPYDMVKDFAPVALIASTPNLVAEFEATSWFAVFAPAGTPNDIITAVEYRVEADLRAT